MSGGKSSIVRQVPLYAMLARVEEADDAAEGARSFVLFEAGGETFAVDADQVEAIVEWSFLAPVPFAPSAVLGIASALGRMRLVVDASASGARDFARLIVLAGDTQIALAADRVAGVVVVASEDVDAARERISHQGRSARLLDADSLLGADAEPASPEAP